MHQTLKSLRETLLECAAMNFRAVFSVFFDDPLLARKVKLPPGVFEDVLEKGKDIHFLVHFRLLEQLFPYRDLLRWENIDIEINIRSTEFYGDNSFLKFMSEVKYPVKTLCFKCDDLSQEDMEQICAIGSTIECLSILYYSRSAPVFLNASFPKLRRLIISKDFDGPTQPTSLIIDLHRFSDTLQELMVSSERIDYSCLNSLPSLTKLSVLSLQRTVVYFDGSYAFESIVFQTLSSMSHLKSLDLRHICIKKTSFNTFSTMLMKLTNLKKLDLSDFHHSSSELEILKPIFINFETIGLSVQGDNYEFLGGKILTSHPESISFFIETYTRKYNYDYCKLLQTLFKYLDFFQCHQMQKVENILLDSLEYCNTIYSVRRYIKTGRCSSDFIINLVHTLCSKADFGINKEILYARSSTLVKIFDDVQVIRCLLEYFRQNLNEKFINRMKRLIFFICFNKANERNGKYYTSRCCIRALESNLFENEIRTKLKQLIIKYIEFKL